MMQNNLVSLEGAFFQDQCFEESERCYASLDFVNESVKKYFRSARLPMTCDGPVFSSYTSG